MFSVFTDFECILSGIIFRPISEKYRKHGTIGEVASRHDWPRSKWVVFPSLRGPRMDHTHYAPHTHGQQTACPAPNFDRSFPRFKGENAWNTCVARSERASSTGVIDASKNDVRILSFFFRPTLTFPFLGRVKSFLPARARARVEMGIGIVKDDDDNESGTWQYRARRCA